MISHNYVCNLGRQVVQMEDRRSEDCNWTALPLFHMNATGGSILSCMFVGARVAIFPRFSVSRFWPDIQRSGATVASLLGSMITFLAEAEDSEASRGMFWPIAYRARFAIPGPVATQMERTLRRKNRRLQQLRPDRGRSCGYRLTI